mmetsp:Transcript_9592/g.21630  ORF Transcript_9592/g.21630 Transcript_9592/m.21630 type:complete len:214 (-) Transcript_9592:1238-1879(-)
MALPLVLESEMKLEPPSEKSSRMLSMFIMSLFEFGSSSLPDDDWAVAVAEVAAAAAAETLGLETDLPLLEAVIASWALFAQTASASCFLGDSSISAVVFASILRFSSLAFFLRTLRKTRAARAKATIDAPTAIMGMMMLESSSSSGAVATTRLSGDSDARPFTVVVSAGSMVVVVVASSPTVSPLLGFAGSLGSIVDGSITASLSVPLVSVVT